MVSLSLGPFAGGVQWLHRFVVWTLVLLGCLVSAVVARRVNSQARSDALSANSIQMALVSATAVLVGYWMSKPSKDEGRTAYPPVNQDKKLTWRDEEGLSVLVPVHPKGAVDTSKLKKYTMAEVSKRSTPEEAWIIIDERVYNVTNFIAKHPGGELVLLNMAGKDCTDAFTNYHAASIYQKWLPAFLIGQVTDVPVYPHVQDFRAIRQELLRRGLFETNMVYYYKMFAWYGALFITSLYLTLRCQSTAAHMVGAFVMGMFWQQIAGLGHDLGHSSVSHNFQFDGWIGATIGCSLMGISAGWWKRSHNTHHIVCNSIENDPDIQHLPVFAVTPKITKKPFWSSYHEKVMSMDAAARFLVGQQHWFFPIIMVFARFNLYAQSWILLLTNAISPKKNAVVMHFYYHEIVSMSLFAIWVTALACSLPTWEETIGWLFISHGVTCLLHVQIVYSHYSMETYHGNAYNDASDEWYIMQIKTTMNTDCYEWMDWFHIGLQFQIEHHLFPTLPRHNLRTAKYMVMEVCRKHGIAYEEHTFLQGVIKTIMGLRATALETRKGNYDYETSTRQIRDLLNAHG
jgi:acyl-lipid Delta6-acetylenase / acyl-lipid (9-3)-desaturase